MNRPPESLKDRLATIIQSGHVERRSADEVAEMVMREVAPFATYVWDDVLTDYSSGIAFAVARTEEEAWALIKERDNTAWWSLRGRTGDDPMPDHAIRPKRIDGPVARVVWGGG